MAADSSTFNIVFSSIENANIFTSDFRTFTERNSIAFSKEGMAVIYGPNGTGKTSLVRTLVGAKDTKMEFEYGGNSYSSGEDVFVIINDQNHRNIIQGSAKDFLIGANILKEHELRTYIESEYPKICERAISELKSKFFVTASTNKLIDSILNVDLANIVKALANNKNKGKSIDTGDFINVLQSIKPEDEISFDEETLTFFLKDSAEKNPITLAVLGITVPGIVKTPKVNEIEENSVALEILSRFPEKSDCIVCDNENINPSQLVQRKTANRENVIASLDDKVRSVVEQVIAIAPTNDPFSIKSSLLDSIANGNAEPVINLQQNIKLYRAIAVALLEKFFSGLLAESNLSKSFQEYVTLIEQKPDVNEEDFLYIEEIISGSMRKDLKVTRDEKKNIIISLSDNDFLGRDRDELQLSSGEQNFLSLAFEFLRAKNVPQPVVVLDDPISSFDSIYKNKVVYAIAKMLEKKQRIILTHNIDMIRLLDAQYKKSFKMYLLNNTENEINGFIPLKFDEQDMLINLANLLMAFRNNILNCLENDELYLISMIPFMRGYANICNKITVVDELTKVMHGYKTESVNIANIYHQLFDEQDDAGNVVTCPIKPTFIVDVNEILKRSVDGLDIVDTKKYPLLNKTLKHTFTYLSLRLIVEQTLVNKFGIDTARYSQLGQIIDQSFANDTDANRRMRVKLTSKKTLINEFNHFEGNLSIFQPAIDITDTALHKEKSEILSLMDRIKAMEGVRY